MKPIGACIFVVSFLMIFASLVRFYVFVMPPGGSKMLVVDVSIGPYQWLGRSPSHHEVLTPVQLLLRLQNHHHHTQSATTTTTTPQTSLAMDQEEKKQGQSIRDQLKGHSLPDGGEIVESINSSSSEFNATNNRPHIVWQYFFVLFFISIVRQYESGSTIIGLFNLVWELIGFCMLITRTLVCCLSLCSNGPPPPFAQYPYPYQYPYPFPYQYPNPRDIRSVDLKQHFGQPRADVAALYGASVSKFKRVCREQGIKPWPYPYRKGSSGSVSKPPDQHGERNTSTACETPSHNVQTGIEGELFGQNEVANVSRRDFMGGPNALDTESGLIMVSGLPDQHGERNTSIACETSSHNVENEIGCQNSKPNEFQPDSFEDLNFWNTEIGSIAEILSDSDFLALEEEPSLEGPFSGSVNLTVAACSDPAPCQHPMPTIPDTMTTTHMMPHLAAKGDMRFVTLKVTYGKKIIKFQFPLMSGIIELKKEVKKRLKLELDSFDIEYKDEDGDCIFLGCDEDLRNHLQLFSNQVIRLLVVDSDANTANFR